MTFDEARKLEKGTKVFVVCFFSGTTTVIKETTYVCFHGDKRGYCEVELRGRSFWLPERIHLTENEARVDMRSVIEARIRKLQNELTNWQ